MGKHNEKDTGRDTGSSQKEVRESFHDARNDAAEEGDWGVPPDRHGSDSDKGK